MSYVSFLWIKSTSLWMVVVYPRSSKAFLKLILLPMKIELSPLDKGQSHQGCMLGGRLQDVP